jgi:nucleotide-binding universal stress UspA family protein
MNQKDFLLHVASPEAAGRSQAILNEALARLAYSRSQGLIQPAEGVPLGEAICRVANEQSDLVVMGTQGRTGLRRLRMPSVAQQVACGSRVPVVRMRPAVAMEKPELRA